MNINLEIPKESKITITGIKVDFVCNQCHKTWAVYLLHDGNLPESALICRNCSKKEIVENGNKKDDSVRYIRG
jgi:Zn finger protein HypA/HybF involved in hydrogenase expression